MPNDLAPPHYLYLGDCLDVMATMPNESIDLIVTSPPYNVGVDYGEGISDKKTDYGKWIDSCLREFSRLLIDGGRICLNMPSHTPRTLGGFEVHDLPFMARKHDLSRRATHIWFKPNHVGGTAWGSYLSPSCPTALPNHEYVFVFDKGYKREDKRGHGDLTKEEFVQFTKTVWSFSPAMKFGPKGKNRLGHNAPFPTELPYRCIGLHSWPGDVVLDPFMGSGTTGIVALQAGREFIGIELNPESFALAEKRIKEAINPLQPKLIA